MLAAQALTGLLALASAVVASPILPSENNNTTDLAGGLEARGTIESRSFKSTCKSYSIAFGWPGEDPLSLAAECKDQAGNLKISWLNLNYCIKNNNGQMQWGKNGMFMGSCDRYGLIWDYYKPGYTIKANCRMTNGNMRESFIDLDERIHNYNGVVNCDV